MRVAICLFIAALLAAACNTGSTGALGSRSDAIAYFTSQGFSGSEASAPASAEIGSGTAPLWVGKGPGDSLGEVSGNGNSVDWVSISVDAQGSGGDLVDGFLHRFAPGSGTFYGKVLDDTSTRGQQNQVRTIGGRTVRIQTVRTGDTILIAVNISTDSASSDTSPGAAPGSDQ